MKKYLQSIQHKRHSNLRSRCEAKKRTYAYRFKRWKKNIERLKKPTIVTPVNKKFLDMDAPLNFSFINNTEKILEFFEKCKFALENKFKIKFNMRDIETLTPDAIALLISNIKDKKFNKLKMPVSGNGPKKLDLVLLFLQSGFYDYVNSKVPHGLGNGQNLLLHKETHYKVHPKLAKEACIRGISHSFGTREIFSPLYEILIECMSNTNNHAGLNKRGIHKWWLYVHQNPINKITSYSFIDLGVGIFESLPIKTYRKVRTLFFPTVSNTDLMKDVLDGKIRSSTDRPERGKGLPQIYQHSKNENIGAFIIISNDVHADIKNDKYTKLKNKFSGTFLYWELHPKKL